MSVRRIRVSGEVLNAALRSNEAWESRLPADANVIEIQEEDRMHHCFVFLVESQEFPAIPEGKLIPFIEPKFRRRQRPS